MNTDYLITCRECKKHGRISEFNNCCDNERCNITMARRNKNHKPGPILLGDTIRHHVRCRCDRCLNEGADKLQAVLLSRPANTSPAPQQSKRRVFEYESEVCSTYDEGEKQVYVEVPAAICVEIYPHGGRRK